MLPPFFGGPGNFIKRRGTSQMGHVLIVVNSNLDSPIPLSETLYPPPFLDRQDHKSELGMSDYVTIGIQF